MERLPPLNAIKTFEVAARAGSFTLAASELGVSSAAVSQQIRNLETWFGKQLFVRSGNRIALTDADRLGKARPGHRAWPVGHGARRSGGRSADCALLRLGAPRAPLLCIHAAGQGRPGRCCRPGGTAQSSGARDLWEGRGAALKPDPDGGVQVAGFSGIGDTGAPGPIFCRLPVITWSPSATPLRMAT